MLGISLSGQNHIRQFGCFGFKQILNGNKRPAFSVFDLQQPVAKGISARNIDRVRFIEDGLQILLGAEAKLPSALVIRSLPDADQTIVWPAHMFGSFSSGTGGSQGRGAFQTQAFTTI